LIAWVLRTEVDFYFWFYWNLKNFVLFKII
jgi:hypothetical protein